MQGISAAFVLVDIPTDWDPRTNQQPTGLLIALPAAVPCCSNPSGSWIKRKLRVSRHGVLLFMDLEGFEPLTSRMRTERSPMRTLKKPPKNRTFLCETAKKYRRNAGFQTSITFEKKLPFLLQCEKVTLQEGCASDAIWTGDHLNTSCGSRTVWGWFGLYPLYNKIDEKQLDFFWLFLFYCTNRQKQCRRLRTQRRWKCPKKVIKYRVALYKI